MSLCESVLLPQAGSCTKRKADSVGQSEQACRIQSRKIRRKRQQRCSRLSFSFPSGLSFNCKRKNTVCNWGLTLNPEKSNGRDVQRQASINCSLSGPSREKTINPDILVHPALVSDRTSGVQIYAPPIAAQIISCLRKPDRTHR